MITPMTTIDETHILLRASTSDDVDALPIEGIPPRRGGECDDEVCTVSPAVEATVRSLGRDVARCAGQAVLLRVQGRRGRHKRPRSTWNRIRFSPGVRYTDGFRTFVGVDGYERLTWIRELLDKPDVVRFFFIFFLFPVVFSFPFRFLPLLRSLVFFPFSLVPFSLLLLLLLSNLIHRQSPESACRTWPPPSSNGSSRGNSAPRPAAAFSQR